MTELTPTNIPNRSRAILLTISIFVFLGVLFLIYWFSYARFHEYTDDCYVDGNQVLVNSQIPGIVISFSVLDGDLVEQGKTLAELDPTDTFLALERTQAELADTIRNVMGLFENVKRDASLIQMKKAEFIKSAQDYEHRKSLVEEGGVSLEDFEHAVAALTSSFYDLNAIEHQYITSVALIENTTLTTHPLVESAKNRLREAFVLHQRRIIKAPVTGIVAQRTLQVGQQVEKGEPLLSIIPLDQLWITANFKETQIKHIRIGQPVEVTCDTYGHSIVFLGKVSAIGGGTGSVFSLLPPQNATGNWIKIVQRVPIRIMVEQEMLKDHPLRLGLSTEANVSTHNRKGSYVPLPTKEKSLYETTIFASQEAGAEPLIEKILLENLSPTFLQDYE